MELPVYECGQGSPILLIHGIISDASFFSEAALILSNKYHVFTYDRCGYGAHIADENADYSISAQSEAAKNIITEYIKEPAWIVGNSAGGLIAVDLCIHHPELVKGLILVEPSLAFDEKSQDEIRCWNAELNGYKQSKKMKKALTAFAKLAGDERDSKQLGTMEELRKSFKNLENFMYGELNHIQCYFPDLDVVKAIEVPVAVWVSEKGEDLLFGRTSKAGASVLGWRQFFIPGFHNSVKNHPEEAAKMIESIMEEARGEK